MARPRVKRARMSWRRRIVVGVLFAASFALFAAAAVLGASYYFTVKTQHQEAAAAVATAKNIPTKTVTITPAAIKGNPVKITVPSVGISEPVDPGYYDASNGTWTLSYHAVYWASMTAPTNNQTGNTFIYGHDVPQIFGNLLKAQVGAKAYVTTDNGYVFTYTLASSTPVKPTDTSQIQQTDAPVMTVQTCSGSWYQYRQMFRFTLDGYAKS